MAAGLLEVARVACELGGEAGRGAKGTPAGTSAHLCGPSERKCSWEQLQKLQEKGIHSLEVSSNLLWFLFRLAKYLLLCPNDSSSFPFVVSSLNPIHQAKSRVTAALPGE